jgi:hypothetical protein
MRASSYRRRPSALTAHQRQEAIERLNKGNAQADVPRSFNVSQATISRLAAPSPFDHAAIGQGGDAGMAVLDESEKANCFDTLSI